MPPIKSAAAIYDPLLAESHETRIQSLERRFADVGADVATVKAGVEAVERGVGGVSNAIQAGFQQVGARIAGLDRKVDLHSQQLEKLNTREQSRRRIGAGIRKYVGPILLAACGGCATKLGEMAWVWFRS